MAAEAAAAAIDQVAAEGTAGPAAEAARAAPGKAAEVAGLLAVDQMPVGAEGQKQAAARWAEGCPPQKAWEVVAQLHAQTCRSVSRPAFGGYERISPQRQRRMSRRRGWGI